MYKVITNIKIIAIVSLIAAAAFSSAVNAIDVWGGCTGAGGEVCAATGDDVGITMKNVINALIFLLGIAAVVMVVVGGFKYTTSNGDAAKVKSAKDTILYSMIGVVVAILSFAIVQFVVDNV